MLRKRIKTYLKRMPEQVEEFSHWELEMALRKGKGTSAGPDGVRPLLLRQLSRLGKDKLLQLLNRSWREGQVPTAWKRATIVPLPKPDKPTSDPASYRPVALLNVTAKLLESMVATRLAYWAQANGRIPSTQGAFQEGRSSIDCAALICQQVWDNFEERQRTMVAAIDFTGAYDKIWREDMLGELTEMECPQEIVRWVRAWLKDRRARTKWNAELSKPRVLEEGIPQGSPLSPILYILATASLTATVEEKDHTSVVTYADDITVLCQGRTLEEAGQGLQTAVDRIDNWAREHGAVVSGTKSKILACTTGEGPKRKTTPQIHLRGQEIPPAQPSLRLLGVEVDPQLRFSIQARKAAAKIRKTTGLLRAIAGTTWGASEPVLTRLAEGFVIPSGLHALGVWGPFLSDGEINHVQAALNGVTRAVLGVARGTNAEVAAREAGTTPLTLRVESAAAKLVAGARRWGPDTVLGQVGARPEPAPRLQRRRKTTYGHESRGGWRSLGQKVLNQIPPGALPGPLPHAMDVPPPHRYPNANITFTKCGDEVGRKEAPEARGKAGREALYKLRAKWDFEAEIYSDGAADEGVRNIRGGAYIHWRDGAEQGKAEYGAEFGSSTTAEAMGAVVGLDAVRARGDQTKPILLAFDSMALHSRLQKKGSITEELTTTRLKATLEEMSRLRQIVIAWIPGHSGIVGNELADRLAGEARRKKNGGAGTMGSFRRALNVRQERGKAQRYHEAVGKGHWHYRCSGGGLSLEAAPASRRDRVLLRQMRVGRTPFLQNTLHRWGRADSSLCPSCGQGDEDEEHYLLRCQTWVKERRAELGPSPEPSVLQVIPESVIRFVHLTARDDRPRTRNQMLRR